MLGIDLGGTKVLAVGIDDRGVQFRARLPTGRGFGPDAAVATITSLAADARQALGGLDGVGIGFPGLVDHDRGVARSSTMLDGWNEVDLAGRVARELAVPCAIDNDVNTAALHEQLLRDTPDLLYVAIGTGIGGALVLGGELRRGANGAAGEIGHVSIERDGASCTCGRRGCVNLYASGTAIERGVDITAAADALAVAIGSVVNVIDVPLVVLGGGVVEHGASYVERVAVRLRSECFREIGDACVVEASRGGYDTGALGAAALVQPRSRAITASAAV